MNSNAATDSGADLQPAIATDRAGRWIVVWQSRENLGGSTGTDGDILFAISTDFGRTWSAPKAVNSNANTDSEADRAPVIETDTQGTWVVAWHAANTAGGRSDQDIFFSRSTDGGNTWSATTPLNSNAGSDEGDDFQVSLATDRGGKWVAAWSSNEDFPGIQDGDSDVVSAGSSDNGATWSAPSFVRADAMNDKLEDFNVQVRTDARDTWMIVWESGDDLGGTIGTDQDILAVRSTDAGLSWSPPVAVNATARTDMVLDSFPSLATDGSGAWVCVWNAGEETVTGRWGNDSDILAAYSLDGGATWSAPAALEANAGRDTAADSMPFIAASHSGRWVMLWQSFDAAGSALGQDGDILYATIEKPLFWSEPVVINTDAANDARADMFLRLGSDEHGTMLAVWNGTSNNVSDELFARSTDNGVTWSAPARFTNNATALGGRDPRVITDHKGTWMAVWTSANQILSVRSTDNGQTWSAPVSLSPGDPGDSNFSPFLATDRAGNWVLVWGTTRASLGGDFDVMSANSTDNGATWSAPAPLKVNANIDKGDDFDPQVATDGQGQWIAVWMSNDTLNDTIGTDDDLLWAFSSNNGASWSPPTPFNPNAATDDVDDDDYTPQIATDRNGNWVVAWHSESTLGKTIGTDADILYMRSADNGLTWSAPAPLQSNAAADSGEDRYLELAVNSRGEWLSAWQSNEPTLGGALSGGGAQDEFDILIARSNDGGATWSPAAPLNPSASTDAELEITPSLVPAAGGKWLAGQPVAGPGGDLEIAAYTALQPFTQARPPIPANSTVGGFRIVSATLSGGNLQLSWVGGGAPYIVQTTSTLPAGLGAPRPFGLHASAAPGSSAVWQSVLSTCNQSATLRIPATSTFYRVASVPDGGPVLDWFGEFEYSYPGGMDAVANTILVSGFGINAEVHELVSGALPLLVEKQVINAGRVPLPAGFTAGIEVRGMSFLAVGGSVGYVPGSDAQIAFMCETTNTPALLPGQTGTITFTLGGSNCPPSIPLAALPCGMYQVTVDATTPASGACAGSGAMVTISDLDYIFISSTNRLNMKVDLNPNMIRPPDGNPYPNLLTCVQNRVGVWTNPALAAGNVMATTHLVTITTFPNPAASYFVRAKTPVMGNKGIGTQADLIPAVAQSPAPPSRFNGTQAFTMQVTASNGYHGQRGCNGSCGAPLLFQDKVDMSITAIATDGCSVVNRTLRAAAIYECNNLIFELP